MGGLVKEHLPLPDLNLTQPWLIKEKIVYMNTCTRFSLITRGMDSTWFLRQASIFSTVLKNLMFALRVTSSIVFPKEKI